MLELVKNADLFRGSFAAGCCALRPRRSWLVGILWFEGKSGHLERVEMIGSIKKFRLVADYTTELHKNDRDGEIEGFM